MDSIRNTVAALTAIEEITAGIEFRGRLIHKNARLCEAGNFCKWEYRIFKYLRSKSIMDGLQRDRNLV